MNYRKATAGLLVGTAIIALMAGLQPAKAQTANAGALSTSNSNSGSSSGSSSRSQSSNAGNNQAITFNSNTPSATTVGGGTNNRDAVSYSGGTNNYSRNDGDVTVRTTPTVYAPPVSGGNPCTLAVSGGVSVIGWGAAAGGTFVDQDCANRQKIAMIHNAGYAQAAKELMCNDQATYNAFKTSGQACAFRQQFEAQGAMPPPVTAQPLPVSAPAVAPVVAAPQRPLRRCQGANDQGPCFSG